MILFEQQPAEPDTDSDFLGIVRVLEQESLQVIDRRVAIAARHLELREGEQRVTRMPRERILHDHLPVPALGVGRRRGQRGSPVECVRVLRRAGGRRQL